MKKLGIDQKNMEVKMKELVIIIGTIILGCIIFSMIASDDNSLKSAAKGVMQESISTYMEN